jgi:hypothetical protein
MKLSWEDVDTEREALFYHLIGKAFTEDTPENESIIHAIGNNMLMLKYFDVEQFKTDLLQDDWLIVQGRKGFAVTK